MGAPPLLLFPFKKLSNKLLPHKLFSPRNWRVRGYSQSKFGVATVFCRKSCAVTQVCGWEVEMQNPDIEVKVLDLCEVYWVLAFHIKFCHYTSISELGRGWAPVCSGEDA